MPDHTESYADKKLFIADHMFSLLGEFQCTKNLTKSIISPHSSSDSLNEDKFLDKKNLEDLEVADKCTSGRLKSASLNSSFTYRAITPVVESVLETN